MVGNGEKANISVIQKDVSDELKSEVSAKCKECGKQFKTELWLKKHLQVHNAKQNFQCDLCGKSFKRNSILRAHRRELHSPMKQYACNHCKYTTNNKTNYETHVKIKHLDVNEHGTKCEDCDKKFFRKEDAMRHMISVHNAPRFQCDICDKSYTSKKYLLIHKVIHNPGFKMEHQCVECGKMFSTGGRLGWHVRRMHSGLKYNCNECGKCLSSSSCLRDHMTQHSGEKSHICGKCGKAFATAKYLSIHARAHSTKKPYSCKDCDQSFTQKTSLSVHIRRFHMDVKPFTCEVCLKGFVTRTLLKHHMKEHKTVIVETHSTIINSNSS